MKNPNQKVKVICGKCKNMIIVDDESFFGHDAYCPDCDNEIYIPLPEPVDDPDTFIQAKQDDSCNTKRCPFCKEVIHIDAIKCKHCGEMLDGQIKTGKFNSNILGIMGMILPAASSFFAYYWISQMRLIDNPSEKLALIMVVTIVITSVLFTIEASLLRIGSQEDKTKSGKRRSGPISWFFFCCFLWIIGFPAYLYWRSKYGLKNFVVGGIVIALIFICTMAFLNYAIEDAKNDIRHKIEGIAE